MKYAYSPQYGDMKKSFVSRNQKIPLLFFYNVGKDLFSILEFDEADHSHPSYTKENEVARVWDLFQNGVGGRPLVVVRVNEAGMFQSHKEAGTGESVCEEGGGV